MVAGVIVAAVGDEIVIAHPDEVLHGAELIAVCAGPAIYLLAQTLFRLRMAGTLEPQAARRGDRVRGRGGRSAPSRPRSCSPLLLLAIMIAVIAAEQVSGARRAARGEPSPLEALG